MRYSKDRVRLRTCNLCTIYKEPFRFSVTPVIEPAGGIVEEYHFAEASGGS